MRTGKIAPSAVVLCLGLSIAACTDKQEETGSDAAGVPVVTEKELLLGEAAPGYQAPDPALAGDPEAPDELIGDEEPAEVADEELPDGLETLAACNGSPASFKVSPASPVSGPIIGFGAQFNANLFDSFGRFDQRKLGELATKVRELHPQHVRIFFDSKAFKNPGLMTSFSRTVALAQSTGATINVTYWHGPYSGTKGTSSYGQADMQQFAEVLRAEILDRGHTAIKYVTVQNEPNRTKFNSHKKDLAIVYRNLHAALKANGARSKVKLVFEITRGYRGTKSWFVDWLKLMGAEAGDVLDGYAFHIYWDHDMYDPVRDDRIRLYKDAIKSLPEKQRKPIYVTEFGTRGEPDANKSGLLWPGWLSKGCTAGKKGCRRIVDTTVGAVNNAFFEIVGSRAGFRGFVYWDAYWSMYDKTEQHWSLISKPSDGLRRRPTFYVQKLFSHVVVPGWEVVSVSDPGRLHLRATAYRGSDNLSVVGVNKSSCGTQFRYSGLPNRRMYELVWNNRGEGKICSRGLVTPSGGALTVAMHPRSVVALTTRAPGLNAPACGGDSRRPPGPTCGDGECTDGETDVTCGQDCGCGAANACGSVAPFGCYCDPTCADTGDCCADVGVCQ